MRSELNLLLNKSCTRPRFLRQHRQKGKRKKESMLSIETNRMKEQSKSNSKKSLFQRVLWYFFYVSKNKDTERIKCATHMINKTEPKDKIQIFWHTNHTQVVVAVLDLFLFTCYALFRKGMSRFSLRCGFSRQHRTFWWFDDAIRKTVEKTEKKKTDHAVERRIGKHSDLLNR